MAKKLYGINLREMNAACQKIITDVFVLRPGYLFGLVKEDTIQMFGRCNEIRVYIYITGGAR